MSTFQKIGDRIENLKAFLGKTLAELEKGRPEDYPGKKDRLLGNATISGWLDKDLTWTSDKLEKFLRYWNVNPVWWKTGEGDILNEKSTYEELLSKKEKDPDEYTRILIKNLDRMGELNEYLLKELKRLQGG